MAFTVFLTSSIACDDGSPVALNANILNIPAANIETFDWSGPEPGIANETSQTVEVTLEGNYTVDAKWGVCVETASLNIIRSPVTQPNIDPYYAICTAEPAFESVILTPGSFISYSILDLSSGLTVPELQPGTWEIVDGGLYEGRGLNGFGCVAVDTFEIEIRCIPEINAPNAFYPASTNVDNQTFYIFDQYVNDNFQIVIFNRWGEIVYQSRSKDFQWDGRSQDGKPLPVGTYAYVIRYNSVTDIDQPFRQKRGGVLLLR